MTPLGLLSGGPVARVDDRGTVVVGDRAVGWSVRSEERWHHAATEAAVRQRRLRDTPVVETSMRVPSGDAVATSYAVADAGGAARVVTVIRNDSPAPIVVALDGDETLLRLSRRSVRDGDRPGRVVPVPHRQSVVVEYAPFGQDRELPSAEAVASGWRAQADRGVRLESPTSISYERCLVALGPGPDATVSVVAESLEAALALGWFETAGDATEWLVGCQRGRGRIGPDDASTLAALRALAAWRRAGVPPEHLDYLVGPVAAAGHRLRRSPDGARARDEAIWFLEAAAQPDAAAHLRRAVPPRATRGGSADSTPAGPGRTVVDAVEALVAETDDGVELLGGWTPTWRGVPLEAHDVPTRFGQVSVAVRWHGDRPALLWELRPWPVEGVRAPVWRATRVDPAWTSDAPAGEALLVAPAA